LILGIILLIDNMIFRHITKYTYPIKSISVNKYQIPIHYFNYKEPPLPNISILDKNYSEYFWEQQTFVNNNNLKSNNAKSVNNLYLPKHKNEVNSRKKNKLVKLRGNTHIGV